MRNGKSLLRWMGVTAATVVVGWGCVLASSAANPAGAAPTLEATDSGAPSAIVIFPVTDKPASAGQGMRPAVFNHLVHEKKVTECETCHHTGDLISCTSCHTVEGKKEGGFITLERAMHAPKVDARADGKTPVSCVSCHNRNLKRPECAGCHTLIPNPPKSAAYCAVCHDGPKSMTAEQLAKGRAGELPSDENLDLAAETVSARKAAAPIPVKDIPYTVVIGDIANEYEPSRFTHARHVGSLLKRIDGDKLAAAFHTDPASVCGACHHRTPPSATPPKCGSCHAREVDKSNPGRPVLKAAYHLQCMGCHKAMNVSRPQNTSCAVCHKERAK